MRKVRMNPRLFVCMVALCATSALSAAESVTISEAAKDVDGFLQHTVISPYQSGETDIRILMPEKMAAGERLPIVYVLPVEARGKTKFGDGLIEVRKRDLHNKHRAVYV